MTSSSAATPTALLFIRARLGPKLCEKVESVDVLQDAYLAAHRDFDGFTGTDEDAFLRWLCRIIDHRIRDLGDHFAALKRQPTEVTHSAPTGPVTAVEEDHRQVLLLRYFEGLSAEETGRRMGRSAGGGPQAGGPALAELGKHL